MKKKFTIEVEMEERWIDDFCSMLKVMEAYGAMGHSEWVALYSDGDGDFRPKFSFSGTDYNIVNQLDKFNRLVNYHNYPKSCMPKLKQWCENGNNKSCPYVNYDSNITLFDAE